MVSKFCHKSTHINVLWISEYLAIATVRFMQSSVFFSEPKKYKCNKGVFNYQQAMLQITVHLFSFIYMDRAAL